MNPVDISNALFYGIPLVSCIGYGYESLIACRGRLLRHEPVPASPSPLRPNLPSLQDDGLRLAVAQSSEQLAAARDLVSRRYAWRGYHNPTAAVRNCAADRSAHEVTFIVEDSTKAVGTITLGLDGPLGLLAESTHDHAIDEVRASGRKLCELTRLAIDDSADSKSVLASLLSVAHFVARSMHDVSDAFIEVNPRHVSFYTRVLGFIVAAGEKVCERVSAPSVLLRLELDVLEDRLKRFGWGQLVQLRMAEVG